METYLQNKIKSNYIHMVEQLNAIEKNIKIIKDLGDKITSFPSMIKEHGENIRKIDVIQGSIFVEVLVRDKNFTVLKAEIGPGTIMDWHKHEQTETTIVCEGCLVFETEEEIRSIHPKDIYTTKPNVLHRVTAKDKTITITVLIPAEEHL